MNGCSPHPLVRASALKSGDHILVPRKNYNGIWRAVTDVKMYRGSILLVDCFARLFLLDPDELVHLYNPDAFRDAMNCIEYGPAP